MILVMATPAFVLSIPVIGVIFLAIERLYIKTSSAIKRLDSIARSPLYQHFDETLNGISSIRAMDIKMRFTDENAVRSDRSANAHYASLMINRWLK
jgi:hypothetical protein